MRFSTRLGLLDDFVGIKGDKLGFTGFQAGFEF
jgi:hypothetical protein